MKINIEEYYKRFGPMVYRRCLFLLQDEDRAYDAMQEVFIRLIRNKDRLVDKHPSSLLFRIATNICLNIIESEKRFVFSKDEMLATIQSMEDIESKFIAREALDQIFSKEKESTRTIAFMYYIDKMTYEEIAKEMGMSKSGVRRRLRVLKEKLRACKGEYIE